MTKITTTKFVKIDRCINGCPFSKSNGDGMYCENPLISQKSYDNMIITQENVGKGNFPKKCPLKNIELEISTKYSIIE